MLKQLTPQQYAELVKKDVSTVIKAIKKATENSELMPGVVKIDKYSRFYLLTCTTNTEGQLI